MSKITDITTHPKFQPKPDPDGSNCELVPDDPNCEQNEQSQYLRDWDTGLLYDIAREEIMETMLPDEPSTPAEYPLLTVEEVEASLPREIQEPKMREPETSLSVCWDCTSVVDRRPVWLKFLFPFSPKKRDLVCSAFPRKRIINPITGRGGYVPAEEALSDERKQIAGMVDESFPHCYQMNPTGTCERFARGHYKV